MLSNLTWAAILPIVLHATVALGISLRVITSRRPTGVALSWIVLVFAFPVAGALAYLFIGETWLGRRRTQRRAAIVGQLREAVNRIDASFGHSAALAHPAARAVAALGRNSGLSPTLDGNRVEVLPDADHFFDRLIADIDAAQTRCDMLYYIWCPGGRVDRVTDAIVRAAERGVACRVLVDAVGSKEMLRGRTCEQLRRAGIDVRVALPVGLLRGSFNRIDIRNHRKLVILDNLVAYTGSQNMADPLVFESGAGFGPWVDLTARIEGPATAQLGAIFEIDWAMEGSETVDLSGSTRGVEPAGDTVVQIVPSGPGLHPSALYRMLTAAVNGAERRLTMTTPYFVPDEPFVSALVSAAMRGVETTVVVPAKVNGVLVSLASGAYYDELLDAGVRVLAFGGGLLHAKTVNADDELAIIGTVNLDRRSFGINYELSLVAQGGPAVADLARVHQRYIENSKPMSETEWMRRGRLKRLAEDTARLFSPIL